MTSTTANPITTAKALPAVVLLAPFPRHPNLERDKRLKSHRQNRNWLLPIPLSVSNAPRLLICPREPHLLNRAWQGIFLPCFCSSHRIGALFRRDSRRLLVTDKLARPKKALLPRLFAAPRLSGRGDTIHAVIGSSTHPAYMLHARKLVGIKVR